MESELRSILNNTAQDLLYKKRLTDQIDNQPTLFPELLEECFAKYRAVAASHHVVCAHFSFDTGNLIGYMPNYTNESFSCYR